MAVVRLGPFIVMFQHSHPEVKCKVRVDCEKAARLLLIVGVRFEELIKLEASPVLD